MSGAGLALPLAAALHFEAPDEFGQGMLIPGGQSRFDDDAGVSDR